MDEPIYICKDTELVRKPKNTSKVLYLVKKILWVIIFVVLVMSIIYKENFFKNFSWSTNILLVVSIISVTVAGGGDIRVPSQIEIIFYKEYFIVYREKRYYSRKVERKEINKFFYNDIKSIEYRIPTQKIEIYGKGDFKWFNYMKDGTLPEKPSYDKNIDGLCFFYKNPESTTDYKALFEKYSPIEVAVSEV